MKKVYQGFLMATTMLVAIGASAQSKYKKPAAPAAKASSNATKPTATNPAAKKTTTSKYAAAKAKINVNASASDTIVNPSTPAVNGTSRYRTSNNTAPTTGATTTNPTAPVTYSYDTTVQGGFGAKPEVSLRNNYAMVRTQVRDRKPLEYEDLREDDAVFSHFIWREIDAREKMNQSFMYPSQDDNGDQRFFSLLLSAIKNDSVTAFSADNDRFTKPLTTDFVMNMVVGANDTVDVVDPRNLSLAQTLYILSALKSRLCLIKKVVECLPVFLVLHLLRNKWLLVSLYLGYCFGFIILISEHHSQSLMCIILKILQQE